MRNLPLRKKHHSDGTTFLFLGVRFLLCCRCSCSLFIFATSKNLDDTKWQDLHGDVWLQSWRRRRINNNKDTHTERERFKLWLCTFWCFNCHSNMCNRIERREACKCQASSFFLHRIHIITIVSIRVRSFVHFVSFRLSSSYTLVKEKIYDL